MMQETGAILSSIIHTKIQTHNTLVTKTFVIDHKGKVSLINHKKIDCD